MTTPLVAAFDLSVTRTGICVDGEPSSFTPPKGTLLERCRAIADKVDEHVRYGCDLAVIEAIGTRMINTAIVLGGLHMLVLDRLEKRGVPVTTVTPADLKKYATGSGVADKDKMLLAASRHADVTNNDEADAWWLWALGCHLKGAPFLDAHVHRAALVAKLLKREVLAA